MTLQLEIVQPASTESLASFLEFIEAACRQADLEVEAAFAVKLAVEEACSNVIRYAYPDGEPGPLHLGFRREPGQVVVTLADEGVPFDPEQVAPPDLESGWEERRVGGLGWHLIRQVVDEVHHLPRTTRGNRLTLVKRLSADGRSTRER